MSLEVWSLGQQRVIGDFIFGGFKESLELVVSINEFCVTPSR